MFNLGMLLSDTLDPPNLNAALLLFERAASAGLQPGRQVVARWNEIIDDEDGNEDG